jgi:hypothetical protein
MVGGVVSMPPHLQHVTRGNAAGLLENHMIVIVLVLVKIDKQKDPRQWFPPQAALLHTA